MDIKLLVLDVDGTLLNSNREMSERTIKILKKVQQNGVRIALATGRPTYGVLPFAKAIDLDFNDGFIISYNGAKVLEASTGKVIFERTIDPKMIPYLEKQAASPRCTKSPESTATTGVSAPRASKLWRAPGSAWFASLPRP